MGRILQAVISSPRTRFACRKYTSHISDRASLTGLKENMLMPVLCRCGHEFGFECLSSWLSPNGGKNSCPNCRREVFPTAPNVNNGFERSHFDNLIADMNAITASLAFIGNTLSEPNRAPLPSLPPLPPVLTAQRPGLRGADPVAPTQRRPIRSRSRRWS